MDQLVIFKPFIALMLLTILVWIYMYWQRLRFIFSSELSATEMTPAVLARVSPPKVSNTSDNLKNLFEIPTIFYALALYLNATQSVDSTYVVLAWGFFAFRVMHTIVHCTFNYIPLQFALYVVSSLSLWVMVVRAALGAVWP